METPHTTNTFVNTTNTCRVCLHCSTNMNNIFDSLQGSESICDRIMFCTGLQISKLDGLPSLICELCLKDLFIAHKFKSTCLDSDEKCHKHIVKIERRSDEDDDGNHYDEDNMSIVGTEKEDFDLTTSGDKQQGYIKIKGRKKLVKKKISVATIENAVVKQQSYNCGKCDISFTTKSEVIKHRKQHDPKDYICEICGRVFLRRSTHYTHLRSHRPPRYSCDHCDYSTAHKHDLLKHVRIHTGLKQYQCEYCTAAYYVGSNLNSHIQRCHKKVKNFSCPICNYQFFDKIKLKMHIDSHNDIKRHHCEFCGSNFSRACYLKKHLQKNHGVEPTKVRPGRQKINLVIGEIDKAE